MLIRLTCFELAFELRMRIVICQAVFESMIEHARREHPMECCGLLAGRGKLIEGITRSTNLMRSCSEFEIPPQELFAFMEGLRRDSREFLGIYHSHTQGNASPSERDARELYYPEVSYWIISTWKAVEVCCYRWLKGGFEPVPYQVVRD